jgi:dimethylhistidine N-methyltransferase
MRPRALAAFESEFARDVHEGLSRSGQKTLPCRYFYDDVGSALFLAISALSEYGLTRADDRIIREHAGDLAEIVPAGAKVIELGSGSGAKTRSILEAMADGGRPPLYAPIDVSPAALAACVRELSGVAEVEPVQDSYLDGLCRASAARRTGERWLLLFLGSTIGNFQRDQAQRFLADVRRRMLPGDLLLLGTDLEKPEEQMLLAYDDPAGVTAAFNLNLLARINRELGGDFDLRRFVHEARYDRQERRIEMHLRSLTAQRVRIGRAAVDVELERDETIWTESSHKFGLEEVRSIAARAGFSCLEQWVDEEWPFAESLLAAT